MITFFENELSTTNQLNFCKTSFNAANDEFKTMINNAKTGCSEDT